VREAYDLLAAIFGWFTEGFLTKDPREAKAQLCELTPLAIAEPLAITHLPDSIGGGAWT
jgi:hypothetical protein